ncbi:unnamed protein product [Chrysoparadoxa australica]
MAGDAKPKARKALGDRTNNLGPGGGGGGSKGGKGKGLSGAKKAMKQFSKTPIQVYITPTAKKELKPPLPPATVEEPDFCTARLGDEEDALVEARRPKDGTFKATSVYHIPKREARGKGGKLDMKAQAAKVHEEDMNAILAEINFADIAIPTPSEIGPIDEADMSVLDDAGVGVLSDELQVEIL